ncbi:MAG: triose-phosphate isomerase [Candidatus Spechtbacterales bacterium]|nr:triose-phosphate isomerase [Candidatus Spechtbacterales bacterium]
MKNRKIYLIGNWKMNPGTVKKAKGLAVDISVGMESANKSGTKVVVCPPYPYLELMNNNMSGFELGAQNCHFEDQGAYTGEVSPKMLQDIGCKYVIVGHSERREYFAESGELINKKIKSILKHGMIPILAVGEKDGEALNIVSEQIKVALDGIPEKYAKTLVVAYEPIWAIGTGNPATPDEALSAKILIRKTLRDIYSTKSVDSIPIIYGGSTNSKNIKSFIESGEMDGALVGGASLEAKEFIRMAEAIN